MEFVTSDLPFEVVEPFNEKLRDSGAKRNRAGLAASNSNSLRKTREAFSSEAASGTRST